MVPEPESAATDADELARVGEVLAELRGVSERIAQRDWRKARLVLHHLLGDADPPGA